jgi:hypothetical protein
MARKPHSMAEIASFFFAITTSSSAMVQTIKKTSVPTTLQPSDEFG